MAPLYVPVPHFDYAIIFMRVYREDDLLHVSIACQNRSYELSAVPLLLLYDNEVIYELDITFSGIPYEVVLVTITGPLGDPSPQKPVEAFLNWNNKENEENPDNNTMLYHIDID